MPEPVDCETVKAPTAPTPQLTADILNALPVGVVVLDQAGLVFQANRQAAALVSLALPDLPGRSILQLWPHSSGEIMAIAASGRQTAALMPQELEDCYVQVTPLPRNQGALLTIFDQRLWRPFLSSGQTPDSLAPYYKKIFDSSADGICVADRHGRMLLVNQASADHVGVDMEELQFQHVNHLVENNLASGNVTMDVIKTRQRVTKLVKFSRSGKSVLLTGQPILSPDGQVQLVVINERDLTRLLELETSLKRQKRITARFKDELESLRLAELADQEIVAKSPAMARTMDVALKLARHGAKQILLTGESGTGKGLLAKFIHAHSANASEPFIHINCAALPETLLEAELFGHEAGAFTGAAPEGRAGLFEAAGRGTAFLDEIGEMPLGLQAKLLTFLDNREFRRLAGRHNIPAPCTVIAATNRDLELLAKQKKFRQDLYWRLSVFCIHLPPLRERLEDLLELVRLELEKQNTHYGLKRELDAQALELIQNYPFPGNVRELLNRLQQAALLSEGPSLGPFLQRVLEAKPSDDLPPEPARPPAPRTRLAEEVAQTEKTNLAAALKISASTREMAAKLGISQASVSRKLRKHGLKPPNLRRSSIKTG